MCGSALFFLSPSPEMGKVICPQLFWKTPFGANPPPVNFPCALSVGWLTWIETVKTENPEFRIFQWRIAF